MSVTTMTKDNNDGEEEYEWMDGWTNAVKQAQISFVNQDGEEEYEWMDGWTNTVKQHRFHL